MNLKNFLEEIIEDYLYTNADLFSAAEVSSDLSVEDKIDAIFDAVDSRELARVIELKLKDKVFRFNSDSYAYQVCESCGKSFGDFVSESGHSISPDDILKHGKQIIFLD